MAKGDPNRKLTRDYLITIVLTVIVSLFIRFYVLEAYRIPTVAMRPTFEPGDTVFVVKWGNWAAGVLKPGDLILYSPDESERRDYIKRVIALAGDSVEFSHGRLLINNQVVEPHLLALGAGCGTETLPKGPEHAICMEPPPIPDSAKEIVPVGSLYVLGDLRSGKQFDPADHGRSWGVIPLSAVKGQVLCTWLSIEPGSSGLFPKFRFERMFKRAR
jgi:signal peptidase I